MARAALDALPIQEPADTCGVRLSEIQDENGVDLPLLRHHMGLTVEERLRSLEARFRDLQQLRLGLRR